MKRILLTLLVLATALAAQSIEWHQNYKKALEDAQKTHRPIMFIASKSDCKYCKKLKSETLKDPKVVAKLNKEFVSMLVVTDEEGSCMPYMLAVYTKGFPTIWFLDEHGQVLFQPIGGYIDSKTMLEALDTVTKAYKELRSSKKQMQKKVEKK